MQARMSA